MFAQQRCPRTTLTAGWTRRTKSHLIIGNSVAQYFPSIAYLENAICRARARLAPGGPLCMDDIRHGGLKAQHAATSAFFRGGGPRRCRSCGSPWRITFEKDRELQIDPSFFLRRQVRRNRTACFRATFALSSGEGRPRPRRRCSAATPCLWRRRSTRYRRRGSRRYIGDMTGSPNPAGCRPFDLGQMPR